MDGEPNLPAQSRNVGRPNHPDSNPTRPFPASSSSSFSSSPPGFLRNVQAAFKRHRPLVTTQTNNIRPKRTLVSQRAASRSLASSLGTSMDEKSSQHVVSSSQGQEKNTARVAGEIQEDASVSVSEINTNADEEECNPLGVHGNQFKPVRRNEGIRPSNVDFQNIPVVDAPKQVELSLPNIASTQKIEWEMSNPPDASTVANPDMKHRNVNTESEINFKSDGEIPSLLSKRTTHVQDQLHQFKNFLQSDSGHPMTQSSVVGSSGATTTLIHSTSAPMVSSTTYSSQPLPDRSCHVGIESGDFGVNPQPIAKRDVLQPSHPSSMYTSGVPVDSSESAAQGSSSVINSQKEYFPCKEQHGCKLKKDDLPKGPSPLDGKSNQEKGFDLTDVQSQAPLSRNSSSDVKSESSKSAKEEKATSGKGTSAPRKRSHDPDLFFKVNGKLYQRLGKIGSGGSSEVHKVISSDCTIYALKKIKLKGRDYATAYGFCQEIEYLNKLKGKNYIIQMIDYEITDKALLREVINGSLSNKDGRVKDDAYIYMVLEYGEIDLAHMLSQKWKEIDANQTIDENWLRFYWQQILLAVNTIHEERIVHSDLKPANFLLVKGSLKLIDFGIAKAIMNDTTNIQRDAQVGTLSYMSPEAFMCNENDAEGNIIKCGRPSDIWSLGCILYQMVYGRTPFSEYKTFWAKFKVITNRNHEITYGTVSNPWLLDLMRNCLAWDRSDRWRIPQLLRHPFLVPPVAPHLSSTQDRSYKLLRLIGEVFEDDEEASTLHSQLEKLIADPILPSLAQSRDQCCNFLSQVSKCCDQLQQHLANSGNRVSS